MVSRMIVVVGKSHGEWSQYCAFECNQSFIYYLLNCYYMLYCCQLNKGVACHSRINSPWEHERGELSGKQIIFWYFEVCWWHIPWGLSFGVFSCTRIDLCGQQRCLENSGPQGALKDIILAFVPNTMTCICKRKGHTRSKTLKTSSIHKSSFIKAITCTLTKLELKKGKVINS